MSSVTALSGAVTGTPSSSTYLRGDGTWSSVSAGAAGSTTQVQYNSSGALAGSANLTFDGTNVQVANSITSANTFGFKNRIINGGMVIDQRNAGASFTPTTTINYTLDRWAVYCAASSKLSIQQVSTAPNGFSNSLKVTSLATTSLGATDFYYLQQSIEGFNTADLGWGTANAKTVTLSFQVYSSLIGTFGGAATNSSQNRSYPFTYSIPVANTWTTISITIAGDTTGTWIGATNGAGILITLGLGVGTTYSGTSGSWAGTTYVSATGAVSVVGTSGATFYITGVQLEVGSQATSFDFRDYGRELILCQRYFNLLADGRQNTISLIANVSANSTTTILGAFFFPVRMRATPTLVTTVASYRANLSTADANSTNTPTFGFGSTISGRYDQDGFTGLVLGGAGIVRLNTDTGYVAVSSEL
jgi:hypothetical protein